jgi:hypothetical protein
MILAAFHLAARRDRSTHQKQEPSDGYVSISCDVAKCRQSATGPETAMIPDQGRGPLRLPVKIDCSNWNAGERCSAPSALPGQMQLIGGLGLRGPAPKRYG